MEQLLWVCVGGGLGSGLRHLACRTIDGASGTAFPLGTLAVNVVGSFAIGFVMTSGIVATRWSPTAQLAVTAGVLGGFTTFSTFSHDTLACLQRGALGTAVANVGISVGTCLLACALGSFAGRAVAGPG